jgi:hypothetical protein
VKITVRLGDDGSIFMALGWPCKKKGHDSLLGNSEAQKREQQAGAVTGVRQDGFDALL